MLFHKNYAIGIMTTTIAVTTITATSKQLWLNLKLVILRQVVVTITAR